MNLQIIHYQYDSCYLIAIQTFIEVGWFMVFNATFNNISVISWQHYSHMDEISAHWNIKQVTIHPIFIVRHSPNSTVENPVTQKESLIMISDSLEHDTGAV
jgi:hypothetical protein